MRRTALIAVLLPIALAAIAVPAWVAFVAKPSAAQLQPLADSACSCERSARDVSTGRACWRQLERLIGPLEHPGITACFPLSEHMIDTADGSRVVLGCRIVTGGDLYLCSKAEAVTGEAIWNREANQGRTEAEQQLAFERANAALIRFAEALKRGERLETLKPAKGCVTGYPL